MYNVMTHKMQWHECWYQYVCMVSIKKCKLQRTWYRHRPPRKSDFPVELTEWATGHTRRQKITNFPFGQYSTKFNNYLVHHWFNSFRSNLISVKWYNKRQWTKSITSVRIWGNQPFLIDHFCQLLAETLVYIPFVTFIANKDVKLGKTNRK